ncbi:MAG: BON domain-containing protein [Pirellula staleyi]
MKTDSQLKTEVLNELRSEPSLHVDDIEVNTHNGTVTLSGTVKHFADKYAAERATQRVAGVRAIAQHLVVAPSGIYALTDTQIAESVVRSLKSHVLVPDNVQAIIEDGWVTLSGEANWAYQREAAEEAIRFLAGVKGLSNNIMLTPNIVAHEVFGEVLKSLNRNGEIDASHISVTGDQNTIYLKGTVHTWAERREACTVAWNSPGVKFVQNELEVVR